jgi:hypothetical protein
MISTLLTTFCGMVTRPYRSYPVEDGNLGTLYGFAALMLQFAVLFCE